MKNQNFENLDLMSLEPKKLSIENLLSLVDYLINENFNLKNDLLSKEEILNLIKIRKDDNKNLYEIFKDNKELRSIYISRNIELDFFLDSFNDHLKKKQNF